MSFPFMSSNRFLVPKYSVDAAPRLVFNEQETYSDEDGELFTLPRHPGGKSRYATFDLRALQESFPEFTELQGNPILNKVMKQKLINLKLYEPDMSPDEMLRTIDKERRKFFSVSSGSRDEVPVQISGFLKSEKFSDVILEVDGVELKSYKNILAAQSPVFDAIFSNGTMKEAQENRVVITDIDVKVVEQMLEFFYTNDKPSKLDLYALELLAAAEKYDVYMLKLMCQEKLIEKLSVNSAIEILIWADLYGSEKFQAAIMDFIALNPCVLKSTAFEELKEKNPKLAFKVLHAVLDIIGVTDLDNAPPPECNQQ